MKLSSAYHVSMTKKFLSLEGIIVALIFSACYAVNLNIHVPIPKGCFMTQALRANFLLREATPSNLVSNNHMNPKTVQEFESQEWEEMIDLFSNHSAHITLLLTDFDLEVDADIIDNTTVAALNETKVASFLKTLSKVFADMPSEFCELSFIPDTVVTTTVSDDSSSGDRYYQIKGDYTMLPVKKSACLQKSDSLLDPLQSYLKRPPQVPAWIDSLPEPEKSQKLSNIEAYGSPNVLESYDPHVTVGYVSAVVSQQDLNKVSNSKVTSVDSDEMQQRRANAMNEWNKQYTLMHKSCRSAALSVSVGRVGVAGTVLTGSIIKSWSLLVEEI